MSDSRRHAALSNEAMPVAKRRGRKDCRGRGRRRGAESAVATASMASTIGLHNGEKTGNFLLERDEEKWNPARIPF
jgi:hypothetical protein